MSYSTIYNFFYNGNEKMLVGLPVSKATLEKYFTYYPEYGCYEMAEFIHGEREFITVTNGIVSRVLNDF
jgi:hypothetical protein